MTPQQQHEREVEKTQRKLLATEAALLLLLRRKIRSQVLSPDPRTARATLVQSLARAYLIGRIAARSAGALRLDSEITALDPNLAGVVVTPESDADQWGVALGIWALLDGRRAIRAAGGYGDRWLQLVQEQIRQGSTNPYEEAFRIAQPRLETGVITENSQAFNSARQDALIRLSRNRTAIALELVRVWNAQLDACRKCHLMDGLWVPLGGTFSIGEPGGVHIRCRCRDELVPRGWVSASDIAA